MVQYRRSGLRRVDVIVLLSTQLLMFMAIYMIFQLQPHFELLRAERSQTLGGRTLIAFLSAVLLIQISFLLYFTLLFSRYRPIRLAELSELPACTVIVPAYNEGRLVLNTLLSIASSNYAPEKVEMIAVDDGSTDDTWAWILEAKAQLGDRLTIFRQPVNKGKREALYKGFMTGTNDIFVTIDSDSIVLPNTLGHLTSPFLADSECGAVAGNVKVLNHKDSLIARMLNVSFMFSFEFIRSAQSSLGFVLCTPGALSAYRREAVMNCLPEWIDQTFRGKPATIGEDRSMTNMILKQGYKVSFQRDAKVLTNTPASYSNLRKMFTRWGRSNVRESIMMNKYMFKDFRSDGKMGARLMYLHQWLSIIMAFPLTLLMFYFLLTYPVLFLTSSITGAFIYSSIQALFYWRKYKFIDAMWAYPYSLFYAFTLFWIMPYAIITAAKSAWLTRGLNEDVSREPSFEPRG